eukprot:4777487-Pleurochrysis_carterae.AAC.1
MLQLSRAEAWGTQSLMRRREGHSVEVSKAFDPTVSARQLAPWAQSYAQQLNIASDCLFTGYASEGRFQD